MVDTQPVQFQIEKELFAKLKERAGERGVTGYIKHLVQSELLKEEVRAIIAPKMKLGDIEQGKMEIRDRARGINADVYLRDKAVYCEHDKSFDCDHVKYALTLPDLGRLKFKH